MSLFRILNSLFIYNPLILYMPLEDIIIGRDPEDLRKYGKKGCIFLGKHLVGSGFDTHVTNPVLMDVSRPHVLMIVGRRGSGKSYSGSIIAEEILKLPDDVRSNLTVLMIDTAGIFWSMKSANERDAALLSQWSLKPTGFNTRNIVPVGLTDFYAKSGIGYDGTFSIKPSMLSAGDWTLTFGIDLWSPAGALIERVVNKMKGREYGISDIVAEIEKDRRSDDKEKMMIENRFLAAEEWGIFSKEGTVIESLLTPGNVTILDVSLQEWNVRNLMLGILSREIYQARVAARREEETALLEGEAKKKLPLTWIIADEAHNFFPADSVTAATRDLLTLVTQGRQPGISLVFITQQPNKLHPTAVSQSDMVIAHRLTAKQDLDSLSQIMQTYLLEDIRKSVTNLPKTKGSAVILDDNSERLFNIQVRPKQSWHSGGSPVAFKEK